MTTRVSIENTSAGDHDVQVYSLSVETLAGKRHTRSEQLYCTLKPGDEITLYVHECQDLRIVEKPK